MKKKLLYTLVALLLICATVLASPITVPVSATEISSPEQLPSTEDIPTTTDEVPSPTEESVPPTEEKPAITITSQPKSASAYNGKEVKVTVKASGKGLKYEWFYKDADAEDFKKTDSFKSTYYKVKMNSSRDGRQLYCKITDKDGNSVETETVTISMRHKAKITKQPKSVTVYSGETATVSVKASGDGIKYTWYYKSKSGKSFKKTSSFTDDTYSVEMNSSRDGRQVYCKVTDKYGNSVKTKTVTLKRNKNITITTQPQTVAVYDGETANLTVAAKGTGLKYAWYYKNPGSKSFKKTSTFNGTTYSVAMDASKDGRQVYCKITDKYGHTKQTSTATLYVKQPAAQIECAECLAKTNGITFNQDSILYQENKLKSLPLTVNATFQINKDDMDTSTMYPHDRTKSYKETVLFSNDNTWDSCYTISITEDGHPKLGIRPKTWYCRYYNVLFSKVNVLSDEPVNMTITFDRSARTARCYINGKLKQTITDISKSACKSYLPNFNYAIGGDLYSANPNYFRGELYSLAAWSDVRSSVEVGGDYLAGIKTADSKLLAYYDFRLCDSCMRKSLGTVENNLKTEKLWLSKDEVAPVGDYDYSFAVIGDTQELSEDDPAAFTALYQWIVDNKDAHKIEYVLGLGDITQKSYAHEWEHAREQIYKMNGVVPYLLTQGNHDYNTVSKNGTITAGFNKTFDDGIYNQQLTGVMKQGDLSNAYRTIEISGIKYLFMTLDFGPNAQTLKWANSVVEAHPDHRVVMITHCYLYRDGTTLDADDAYSASKYPLRDKKAEQKKKPSLDGDDIWKQFAAKHENVQLIISGHDPSQHVVYRQDKGVNGNVVTQMLVDPQHIDVYCKPTALVAMFYFSNNGNTLTVRYYSVVKDMYGSERSQFTIDLT